MFYNGSAMMRCTSDTSTKHKQSFYFLGREIFLNFFIKTFGGLDFIRTFG